MTTHSNMSFEAIRLLNAEEANARRTTAAIEALGLMIKDIEWKCECVSKRKGLSRPSREGVIEAHKDDIAALQLAIQALEKR